MVMLTQVDESDIESYRILYETHWNPTKSDYILYDFVGIMVTEMLTDSEGPI